MFALVDNYKRYKNKVFNVGIYLRLSRDDDERGNSQSESIKNQNDFLTRFVVENEWNLVDVYCDDGYSGTNFNRPDFKRMIKDIEKKRINMVVTKDLSRLGRDYIETGYYLEKYFPEHSVRYVAVNDGIDTFESSSNNDMSPFKSVVNDMYARDISKKVRTVMNVKRSSGKFIGAFAPYGYLKDPQDRNRLIIDPEASQFVKRIFQMYIDGHGYSNIAHTLNAEGTPTPIAYKSERTTYKNPKSKVGLWTSETIKWILINPTYAGNLTQRKSTKVSYKSKKFKCIPKSDWITVNDTHEPIVDNFTFELVQQIIAQRTNTEYTTEKKRHLLAGLIYCGDCGERMTFTKTQRGVIYSICSKYKRFNLCSRHSILETELEEHVLNDLRRISQYAVDQKKLMQVAQSKAEKQKVDEVGLELDKIEARLAEIKKTIKTLYEDKLRGIITEGDFIELSQDYNREREKLNLRLETLGKKKQQAKQDDNTADSIPEFIKQFVSFTNVSKSALVKLIEKIEIFEDGKIFIHYRFKNPFVV